MIHRDPITLLAAVTALAGIAWLAPLMLDQLVFFADRDQTAAAEAARASMPWPAMLVAAGAIAIAARGQLLPGAVAALPLVAVLLAWTTPGAAYQLLAYGLAAPTAIGALLAAVTPLHGTPARPWVAVAIGALGAIAILASGFIGGVVALGALAWWGLSRQSGRRARARSGTSALD